MIRPSLLVALAAAGLAFSPASLHSQTSTWTIDPNHSSVGFQTKHLAVSTVRGSISGVTGTVELNEKDFEKSSIKASADAKTVTTNNQKRDDHLHSADFFDVANKPTLNFSSVKVITDGGKHKVIGDLTLAGVTKSVTLDLDGPAPPQKNQQGGIVSGFSASGSIKRSDFNFGPKFGNAVISDEVKFTIDIEIDKK